MFPLKIFLSFLIKLLLKSNGHIIITISIVQLEVITQGKLYLKFHKSYLILLTSLFIHLINQYYLLCTVCCVSNYPAMSVEIYQGMRALVKHLRLSMSNFQLRMREVVKHLL